METVAQAPDYPEMLLAIMTGGTAYISELGYPLSDEAMHALNGITFFGADGTPAQDPVWSIPEATTTTAGIVKQAENVAEAAGDAPTAEEFKALLDALIEAGIMAAPEDEEGA